MNEAEDHSNQVQEPDLAGTYTARDYISWKTDELMELIGGKIFKMTPSPTSRHQIVSSELNDVLKQYFSRPCKVFYAPYDVYLVKPGESWKQTKNIFQPDLCVICDKAKIQNRGCLGAPDLVVEILSPGTAAKDLGVKRDLYGEYSVKELWIIHPSEGTITVHVLENGKYHILPLYAKDQTFQSPTFPNLNVDLNQVFTE